MTKLLIWRHGNTDWNAARRVQGQSDVALNDLGRRQAAEAAPLLAALRPGRIWSSDLSRARDTAAALAAVTGLPVRTDARLRERHFGDWQGLHLTEIAERHPEAHARWRTGDPDPGCGVESLDVLGKRIGSALQEIAEAAAGETIVVATHGGAARQACGYLLAWDPSVLSTIGPMHNCHWAELHHEADRGWRLQAYNAGRLVSGAPAEAV